MLKPMTRALLFAIVSLMSTAAFAAEVSGFGLTLVVDGDSRPEYDARGSVYVEALRGRNYSLRLTNPTGHRVAVALSVDGLNTIDARHTDVRNAAKWVLDPYESTVISGWQVSGSAARRFVFTGEKRSYGAALGETDNLGVIEAVYFRERVHDMAYEPRDEERNGASGAAPKARAEAPVLSDDYAATGIGKRTRHEVESVAIDLESEPVASVRLRYEFRPELVKLGVLPRIESPLERRERARGFTGYCPEP
jgi:hypothetical protein